MNRGTLVGALVALANATIGLVVAFGVSVNATERDAVVAFVTAAIVVAPLVGAAWDHSRQQAVSRQHAAVTIAAANPTVGKGTDAGC